MENAKKICILHLITTLDVGGAEVMLLKLLVRMDASRFKNHVICLAEMGVVGQNISAQGISVHALSMPRGRLTIKGLTQLRRLMRQINPDIVQTWMYHADLIGLLFGKISRIRRICWNIRCSEMDLRRYRLGTQITVRLCTTLSSFPDVIIANSKEGANFHKRKGYRAKRWEVIPNGFDLGVFKPDGQAKERLAQELGLNRKEPPIFIGYIARFDPMKDHPTFIKAACLLLQGRGDVHFILAGKDVTEENGALATQIPDVWKDQFHLLGERNDIPTIAAGIDIAALTSYGEGFPNVIGEAMACGVPCVVTDVGDSGRLVGSTGKVVTPKDPYALAGSMLELLALSSEERRKLGRQARERIRSHYSLDKIVAMYESLYSELAHSF